MIWEKSIGSVTLVIISKAEHLNKMCDIFLTWTNIFLF